jgi:hypothetical protein
MTRQSTTGRGAKREARTVGQALRAEGHFQEYRSIEEYLKAKGFKDRSQWPLPLLIACLTLQLREDIERGWRLTRIALERES